MKAVRSLIKGQNIATGLKTQVKKGTLIKRFCAYVNV